MTKPEFEQLLLFVEVSNKKVYLKKYTNDKEREREGERENVEWTCLNIYVANGLLCTLK